MEGWKAERSSGSGRKERDPCPAALSPVLGGTPPGPPWPGKAVFHAEGAGAPARAAQSSHRPWECEESGVRPELREFPSSARMA